MFKKLRLIVEHCTPQCIYAQAPIVGACVVDYGAQQFVYLRKILKPGMTINVLDASQLIEHAVLFPHYIIVEPDFLVDISSIAGCFKEYGHHALNFTVSRLEKSETTQPILLGNYAGAALDEIINERDGRSFNSQHSTVNIQQSVVKCFQSQPLEYITCPNFNSSQFKKDAIAQAHNIREIVRTLREKYDLDKAILEPTFVCEALGLQGRVDMMTTDFRLLIEQKSGKNFNLANSRVSDIGFHVESHYVQLLLYFSVLYFNFGVKKEEIDFYLLYSKYELPKGLLPVEFNDNLIYEALMLRNQIVATDLMVAEKGFQSVRPYLRPEVLNVRGSQSKLWKEYQYPQLEQQLGVLHRSGGDAYAGMPLFRYSGILLYKYFDAMATFVYREQRAAWLGESNEQTTAVSYLWKMSLEEKIETGNIMIANAPDPSIHTREGELKDSLANDLQKLTLRLSSLVGGVGVGLAPNFRRGDSVFLYEYEDVPDVRKAFLHKANILSLNSEEVVLVLKNPLQQSTVNGQQSIVNSHFAIEHSSTNSSTSSSLRSLSAFLKADERRQELLLGQREPQADTTLTLSRSYSPDYDDVILRMKQAKDYFLLIGPPGTGKTSQALKYMVQEVIKAPQSPPPTPPTRGESLNVSFCKSFAELSLSPPPLVGRDGEGAWASGLLLLSYTNRAVDEICEMLDDAGIDFLRIGNEYATDEQWLPHLLNVKARENASLSALKEEILAAKVIVGTTSMISARTYLFALKHFSMAIIDESSQILEPNIIGILSQDIEKFVLIGDYKQLPAVVQQSPEDSVVTDSELNEICLTDCRISLFERLINIERKAGRTQFIGLLRKQGRMHPDIAEFVNRHFYTEENLLPVPLPHQLEESGGRMLFYDIKARECRIASMPVSLSVGKELKVNLSEAIMAARLVNELKQRLGDDFNPRKSVGIIVPYRNQIAAIRHELEQYDVPEYARISIDTVERYQGSQRDVIIYSFTVSRKSQLNFLTANTFVENGRVIDRKLNVAITRARKQFIALGDKDLLCQNDLFAKLIDFIESQNGLKVVDAL